MGLTPQKAYALSKKYTEDVTKGIELIEGKPCTIKSIEAIGGGKRITYQWTADDGTTKTQTMDVMDGEKGDKGDPGNQGVQGVPGPRGVNGTAATVRVGSVISGESPSVINVGTQQDAILNFVLAKGDKGDKGEKGNDGQNGSSFSIRSRFATYEELIAAFPTGPENEGDAYFVGTTASPDLYIWLVEESEWYNNGPIAGVKGDKGDTGEDGFSPVANVTKDGNISTITVRDKVGTTTAQVKDGYSPTMSVSKSGDVITVEVTDESGTTQEVLDLSGKVNTTDVGTAAYKNTTEYVSPLESELPTSRAVYRAMSSAVYGAYHPAGSKTVSQLTSDLLVQANVGNVYKITDSGVTTDLFIEGAGININAGDNAVVVFASENTFKFDLQSGAVDLSGYQEKNLTTAVEGESTVEGALGALSGNKASKVSNATAGDIATLDANGNLVDSGVSTRGVGKYVKKGLSSTGWYKIYECGAYNEGTAVRIDISTYFNHQQNSAHVIDLAFGYNNAQMSEVCRDNQRVFNKLRFCFNNGKNAILVYYNAAESNTACANIISTQNSDNAQVFEFVAVDASIYSSYVEYDLGQIGTYSNGKKVITENEFKSYGITTIWSGSKTKGDTGMNFDASPYDLCFAKIGGTWCTLITGVGGGSTTRKKFSALYAGRDYVNGNTYEQYYLLDIVPDGTIATCGWFDVASKNTQNSRLAGQKALELALAGTSTWADPTWKKLSDVESSVSVSQIIGIKFQTKS